MPLLFRLSLLALLAPSCAIAAEPKPALKAASGFIVEHLYEVPRDSQGSWISLACDPKGALYASDQYGPLFRIELTSDGAIAAVSAVKLPIGGVHGMAFVGERLYAVVGERTVCPPGLYRLSLADGSAQLDALEKLIELRADGEHGPHAVALAPDGKTLCVLAGNATPLPPLVRSLVPRGWQSDALTRLPAVMGSETRGRDHGGWICRTDLEGRKWELVCLGLRNAYGLAFDADGELFTVDSDTEFEIGTPWYRPNRVLHCVSGADFGWRSGALKTPDHSADTLPAVASLGSGSPTAVLFPQAADLPARQQNALLVADWSLGRLLAVHMTPEGASFRGVVEQLVTGTPLAITAACVNPKDRALYFVTGGRKTQSHLYRLKWQR